MKKIVLFAAALLLLLATTAMADSIKGKVGITARGGASYIFNSEVADYFIADADLEKDIKTDVGWAAGGGIMYGITDNLAVTFDVIYSEADVKVTFASTKEEMTMGSAKTIDFSLGAQWRFMPKSAFVPYVEAGFDILVNKIDPSDPVVAEGVTAIDVDSTYGGHLSIGADYFFTPNIALNAEIRGLYSTEGTISQKFGSLGMDIAEYNPSNISGFIGIRFFFP